MKRRKQRTSKTISYVFLLFHHRRRYCHVWLLSWFIWLCLFDRMELMLRSALTSPVRKSTPHGLHCDWDLILPLSLSLSLSPPPLPPFPLIRTAGISENQTVDAMNFFLFFLFFRGISGILWGCLRSALNDPCRCDWNWCWIDCETPNFLLRFITAASHTPMWNMQNSKVMQISILLSINK